MVALDGDDVAIAYVDGGARQPLLLTRHDGTWSEAYLDADLLDLSQTQAARRADGSVLVSYIAQGEEDHDHARVAVVAEP